MRVMHIFRTYPGYCPHLNKENHIDVEYAQAPSVETKRAFKIIGFHCDANEDESCPYAQQKLCPIYDKIPITIEE